MSLDTISENRARQWDTLPVSPDFIPAKWEVLRQYYQDLHALSSKLLVLPSTVTSAAQAAQAQYLQEKILSLSVIRFRTTLAHHPALPWSQLADFFSDSGAEKPQDSICSPDATPNRFLPEKWQLRLARKDQILERKLVTLGLEAEPRWKLKECLAITAINAFEKTISDTRQRNWPGSILLWIDAPQPPDTAGKWAGNWVFLVHPKHHLLPPVLSSSLS